MIRLLIQSSLFIFLNERKNEYMKLEEIILPYVKKSKTSVQELNLVIFH